MTDQAMGEGSSQRRGLPIAWLLALTLGGLVLLAAVPPVVLGYLGARDNTARLLRDRAELTLDAVIDPVSARLERMRDQLAYVAQAVLAGDIDPADDAAMRPFLLGALAATPQVSRITHVRPDRTVTFYDREGRGGRHRGSERPRPPGTVRARTRPRPRASSAGSDPSGARPCSSRSSPCGSP